MVGSNHGGGCACARSLPSLPAISHTPCVLSDLYSLCPSGEPLTERCFQQTPLPFVGSHHTIRYLDNGTQFPIPATDVSEGTWPKGSSWRVNPSKTVILSRFVRCHLPDPGKYHYFSPGLQLRSGRRLQHQERNHCHAESLQQRWATCAERGR